MMPLSDQDSLRLNVLLTQDLQAVRIDESAMAVHALTTRGEARITLAPTLSDEKYLRLVRELLSSQVLGSPGGYPVFIRRWTRMGQARDENLDKLLLLGEPEAVVAVVYANGLTDELARRAWWAMPNAENARRMLERGCVARGAMGPELAQFLIEFLPFEEEPQAMLDSVRLVLQPGLISEEARLNLWNRARHKNTFYVGFLEALPDDLPEPVPAHAQWDTATGRLQGLREAGDPQALALCRALSASGQGFLRTAETVLRKPNNQDVVVAVLGAIAAYFAPARPDEPPLKAIEALSEAAGRHAAASPLIQAWPEGGALLTAMLTLALAGEPLVAPVFARTDAIGSVMRKKIEPVTGPLLEQLALLRGHE